MIVSEDRLQTLVTQLRELSVVALDTEADSLHAYPAKLCLVQITLPGSDELVDPLSGLDLAPLWAALADKELILHGSDYDLRLLYQAYQFRPARLFDTMFAARFAGFRQFGLSDLVRRIAGVELDKASQKADWGKRPLTERMAIYARNDTHFLPAIREHLSATLSAKGRLAWLEETCARLVEDFSRPVEVDANQVWRVKGANRLSRRGLAVIRELYYWREREAVAANRPPFFIVSPDTMIQMAEAAVEGRPYEPFLSPRLHPRRRAGILQAVQRGLAVPAEEWPDKPRHRFTPPTQAEKQRAAELQVQRDRVAADLDLDPTLIASRATLEALARDPEGARQEMLRWQRELLGV